MRLFEERGVVLFDAAMGSALQAAGQPSGTGSEEMNNLSPETVLNIHLENVKAGCDVLTSNTFGISALMMREDKDTALDTLEKAVSLAKEAASGGGPGGREVFVCLCIGPTGKMLGLYGEPNYHVAEESYAAQAEAGTRAGADFILLETFADPGEFACAAGAVKASGLPVAGTMTFGASGRTSMGASPDDLLYIARSEKLIATGANCTLEPEGMFPVVSEIMALAKDLPVIAQPNAGQPVCVGGKTVYELSDDDFIAGVTKLLELGISGIGGCCGTTPAIINRIRDIIDWR